jgi:hypothetical protein
MRIELDTVRMAQVNCYDLPLHIIEDTEYMPVGVELHLMRLKQVSPDQKSVAMWNQFLVPNFQSGAFASKRFGKRPRQNF